MEGHVTKAPVQPSLPIHFELMEIWGRHLGISVPGIRDSFFDLGGHSLLLAPMMDEVERVTGRYVPITALLESPTIAHLADCLVAGGRDGSHEWRMAEIQRGNGRVPFYYFHGDILGGGFYSRKLAQLLGTDQPFYALSPPRLDGERLPTVEEMASEQRRALQERQPRGPYAVGGFCIGALVAYEVARQLAASGHDVECAILIDPELGSNLARTHLRIVERLASTCGWGTRHKLKRFERGFQKLERLRDVWNSPLKAKFDFVVKNGRKLLRHSSTESKPANNGQLTPPDPISDDWRLWAFQWILTAYVPRPYTGRVKVLLTDEQCSSTPFVARKWRRSGSNVAIERIPGRHLASITTHAHYVADRVRPELRALHSLCAAP